MNIRVCVAKYPQNWGILRNMFRHNIHKVILVSLFANKDIHTHLCVSTNVYIIVWIVKSYKKSTRVLYLFSCFHNYTMLGPKTKNIYNYIFTNVHQPHQNVIMNEKSINYKLISSLLGQKNGLICTSGIWRETSNVEMNENLWFSILPFHNTQ